MDLKTYYQEKLNISLHEVEQTKKSILRISLLRVFIFIAGFIALCFGYDQGGTVIGGILLATLIPFLLLVKLHNRLFHQKDWHATSIRNYQEELAQLAIRKLTPKEAFLLQGFPQDFANNARLAGVADGAMYKQAGNAVSVPVIKFIAEYILNILSEN